VVIGERAVSYDRGTPVDADTLLFGRLMWTCGRSPLRTSPPASNTQGEAFVFRIARGNRKDREGLVNPTTSPAWLPP